MVMRTLLMTVEEFDKWVFLPENADKSFEYIGEEIVDLVSNNYSSLIGGEILYHIKHFIKMNKIKGYVTGADGGYQVMEERYIPDVGYISGKRQSETLPCSL